MISNATYIKEAKTQYPVADFIRNRWSPRAFSSEAIPQDALNTLFEAASWASSAMNEQPWLFVYAHRGDEAFQKFADALLPGNQVWAKHAAVLVLTLAHKNYTANGNPNKYYLHDTGAATANLMLQAANLDIYGHIMGGFDRQKTIESFNLPEHIEPVTFIALGYLGDPDELTEPFKSREHTPRHRKDLSEFVFKHELAL
ncbi:hypothetical protein GCM10023189_33400 [Nibrella saemangeumensis]|uniref:Nitroreductase domain-containing protein n=1 Tax=Nibrella saemangeumensis TaxID=1084526 RepID=A0ABP8N189_9BACT